MAISIADSSCSHPRSLGLFLDPDVADSPRPKQSMWHRLGLRRWLGREDRDGRSPSPAGALSPPHAESAHNAPSNSNSTPPTTKDNLTRRLSRRVGVGLPRAPTFKRQNSERRDNLSPGGPEPRRAVSADRRPLSAQRTQSPLPTVDPRLSAPEVPWRGSDETTVESPAEPHDQPEPPAEWNHCPDVTDLPEEPSEEVFEMELERRWILNLSMHFRDRSEREKFFVTYAEAPNRWRRVTISCDYRSAPPDSLEQDLKELRYQRDKCARIYESIRESLPEIQFYDTVTNLKLETRDGRLHVHVTEDVNEIIPYPPTSCIGHLPEARRVPERDLHFEAHLSGFVYNVRLEGKSYIKKEIPGPDTVDEFLYEINALHALQGNANVVQVEGIVVDDEQDVVKGLLISYAEKGALVDILYEDRGCISWERRERWARQIVQGLSDIHEAGYVQGDFTLSNIVVDSNDHAKIIDINRRGCPVGWEPPEIAAKIESNQRISMYIGVKTDLFQLGMTLWALATEEDEPERQPRPLVLGEDVTVPDYYRRVVSICLSTVPQHRLSAKELLGFFPRHLFSAEQSSPLLHPRPTGHGVGLHNGALPLYNTRVVAASAGFLSPRMEAEDVLDRLPNSQPPVDSDLLDSEVDQNEFIPPSASPTLMGYEPRRISTTDTKDREPRIVERVPSSKQIPRIELEEPRQLRGPIPVAPSAPSIPLLTRLAEPPAPSDSEARDIDLDDEFNLHWRSSRTQPVELATLEVEPFSGDLVGVGSNPICSLNPNTASDTSPNSAKCDESPLSAATSHFTEPNMAPTVDLADPLIQDPEWPSPARSRSVSSLLHSMLPINPALSLPGQKSVEGPGDQLTPMTIRSALGYTRQILPEQTPYLSDSHLPINPASV